MKAYVLFVNADSSKILFPSWINPLILIATWLSMFISCVAFSFLTSKSCGFVLFPWIWLHLHPTHMSLVIVSLCISRFGSVVASPCAILAKLLTKVRIWICCPVSAGSPSQVGNDDDSCPLLFQTDRKRKEREGKTAVRDTFCHSSVCQDPVPLQQHASWPGVQLRGCNRWRHIVLSVVRVWTVVLRVPVVLSPPDCCPC